MHGLVDFDLYVPGVALPAFILLGVVQGLKELPGTDIGDTSTARELVGRFNMRVLLLAGSVLDREAGRWRQGLPTRGRRIWRKRIRGRPLDEAKRAVELAPWNPHYKSGFGHVAFLAGRRDEAFAAYRQAAEDDPYRASGWWRLAEAKRAVWGLMRRRFSFCGKQWS